MTKQKEKNNSKYIFIKRFLDIVISVFLIILLSPVFIVLSILIKLTSKGPIFFIHTRIGLNGKKIYIYKFRTMCEDAEEMIKYFSSKELEKWKDNYKIENDIRLTKMGKILRKSSMDELPQLINVIKGEMSLIGPRPIIEEELEKYRTQKEKFLSVKPGITGFWQVNGRSNTTYEERIKMELYYVDNISFLLDLKIFFKTFIAIIRKEGAK